METFAPIVKLTTIPCLLAIAVPGKWSLYQMDVQNAFIHDAFKEEVYMLPPPDYKRQMETSLVCRLYKSFFRLKRASRNWYSEFSAVIFKAGFKQSLADYSLFTKDQKSFTAVLIYEIIWL